MHQQHAWERIWEWGVTMPISILNKKKSNPSLDTTLWRSFSKVKQHVVIYISDIQTFMTESAIHLVNLHTTLSFKQILNLLNLFINNSCCKSILHVGTEIFSSLGYFWKKKVHNCIQTFVYMLFCVIYMLFFQIAYVNGQT